MNPSFRLNENKLLVIDECMDQLDEILADLIALDPMTRRRLFKMGDKSEAFCRQALTLLDQNRQVVPPSLELEEALEDLATIDLLRPRLKQVQRLAERMADTEMALGAEVAQAARKGYALLKVAGRNQGLDTLRGELAGRFRGRKPGNAAQARKQASTGG